MQASKLVEFVNNIYNQRAAYWYGSIAGQRATTALLEYNKKHYPEHYTDTRMSRYNNDIANNKLITDCSGLIKGALMCESGTYKYNSKYDLNDAGLFNTAIESGDIKTIPEIPGILVWKSGHIGVYIGDGYVIEAVGFNYGVQKNILKYRSFIKWFKSSLIEYDLVNTRCIIYTVKSGDTLYKIAKYYNISLSALIRANPQITNIDLIYPCQKINIPISY